MFAVAIVALVVGVMLGLTGAGGGVLAVPLLVLLAGYGTSDAITLSLIGVGAISLAATARNAWRRELPWRDAAPVALAAILGAPLGTWVGSLLPEAVLTVSFVALSLVVAVLMWRGGCRGRPEDAPDLPGPAARAGTGLVLATGGVTGVLAGLFGVGGGFLLVPALALAARQPMRRAAVISLAAITLSTASAVLSRAAVGEALPWAAGGVMAAAGLGAFVAGDAIARRTRPCRLKEVFALALALVLSLMFIHHLRTA